ncbi:MAG TPA: hypothetical protein VK874_08560 [Gaiellaceae bacterium]|nr:hypothetical protein [Gaiellaceae bacterium]
MRRLVDALLLAAVAVVAAAAVVDALEPDPVDPLERARDDLRRADVRGTLLVAEDDCTRRSLVLPALREQPRGVVGCSVYGRPGSLGILRGAVVWYAFPGGVTTLLRPAQLDAYVGRRARVTAVAWLGNVRYAVTYRVAGRPEETLAVFERGSLVRVLGRDQSFQGLRSSPRTRFLAARSTRGLALWDALGDRVELPADAEGARALAWSPDERWAVAASERELTFFRLGASTVTARIPLGAVDVDWERAG